MDPNADASMRSGRFDQVAGYLEEAMVSQVRAHCRQRAGPCTSLLFALHPLPSPPHCYTEMAGTACARGVRLLAGVQVRCVELACARALVQWTLVRLQPDIRAPGSVLLHHPVQDASKACVWDCIVRLPA